MNETRQGWSVQERKLALHNVRYVSTDHGTSRGVNRLISADCRTLTTFVEPNIPAGGDEFNHFREIFIEGVGGGGVI